jgi:branched-chain amino acid transport system substrate-binding protein
VAFRSADHQNKPDVAASIARQWYDDGVDAIIDVPTSSVALAVSQVAREKDKILLDASAAAMEVTADQCCPNTIVWSFDTYEKAHSTGGALMKQGKTSWTFITADYVFGHSLEEQTAAVVKAGVGQVKGAVRYPFPETTDFSAFLQQAMASGAQVLGLANAGLDTVNCVKQANEFGLNKRMTIAPLIMFLQDVHSIGIDDRAGPDHQRDVLLEHERSHPCVHQAGAAQDAKQLSQPGACQRLWDYVALSENRGGDGGGCGQEERPDDRGAHEIAADRR